MNRRNGILLAAAILLAAIAGFLYLRSAPATDPSFSTPVLALQAIHAKPVFYTPAARAFLVSQQPDLAAPDDKLPQSQRVTDFGRALQNPVFFRQLDRREHFESLLLAGDVNQFRPLLAHLSETQDFILTYLDHTSLVFERAPARAWSPEDFENVREKFAGAPASEQAEFLAQSADRFLAINQPGLAKRCLDEALQKDKKSLSAWTESGYYAERLRQWDEALADADNALEIQEDYPPALVLRAQALFATKRFDTAYQVTSHLIELAPTDPSILFLHARIAHQAHAYESEVKALKTLIDLADKAGQPTSGYRIYLGQAYASQGKAKPSLDEFQKVLDDDSLSLEQRDYVIDSINRIRTRIGLGPPTGSP